MYELWHENRWDAGCVILLCTKHKPAVTTAHVKRHYMIQNDNKRIEHIQGMIQV